MSHSPEEFTDQTNKAIGQALEYAQEQKHIELVPLHLAHVLIEDEHGLSRQLIKRAEFNVQEVQEAVDLKLKKLGQQNPPPSKIYPNSSFMNVLKQAKKLSKQQKDSHTAIDHILAALYEDSDTASAFVSVGLSKKRMEEVIKQIRQNKNATSATAEQTYQALEKYGHNLIADAEAGKLDPVIGRDQEIRRCIQVLSRRTKNNPVLIGEPGVGKTAIVEGLARRIVHQDVPDTLPRRLIALDLGALVVSKLSQTERERLLKLSDHLHENVIGQDDAVDSVAEAVLRSRARLSRQNQPNGSFLCLGPAGVGKTELAKTLALELFDSTESMIRIDMSEYTESHSIARLIGALPDYVGFEQDGQLTETVRRQPYAVILFDEVENGHPQIWSTL
ncbi:unnamed protein product [Rotaria magnacalcarata]|uniref:Clp R domain-containing protein n=2 Tax=Rotaria magnacalcarata TaxID=392030 RepID=A0A819Z7I9_9BILA|nr:unnamed protein product [Rotaria magnacalcarata]CAF4169710.1 unnamed protein product [Rotaria magnacalcarata]